MKNVHKIALVTLLFAGSTIFGSDNTKWVMIDKGRVFDGSSEQIGACVIANNNGDILFLVGETKITHSEHVLRAQHLKKQRAKKRGHCPTKGNCSIS